MFAVGASVGSFVGVVVDRLPRLQSVVRPRSRCAVCGKVLRWRDNVPVLSYLLLRGRCAHCGTPIGLRALWLEVAMGGLYCALWQRFGPNAELACWLPLTAALLTVALLDVDHWWVPDEITYPAAAWALATSWLPGRLGVVQALLGLLPALGLWAFAASYARLTGREGMGSGDVKLLAVLGVALGPMPCLSLLTLAAVQGATVGLLVLAVGGHPGPEEGGPPPAALADDDWQPPPGAVPFGPFLVLAGLQVLLLPPLAALHAHVAQFVLHATAV